ncbi:AAA family ATPase [Catenuloplanes indicus]|uniref:ATPase AAA-type core domain-containing protein n=1 Tax=Catenuloplanes indicus TaxID=137267 RepID=A0AAE3VXI8_9ACTN|nr:AAA family ATPase [Catenuloplanes indicus]MDQ0365559.1 hypothetical protein [Catenuloplanes indicus]
MDLLRYADLDIDDVEVVENPRADAPRSLRRSIRLVHSVGGERLSFDMFDESEGTQTWYRLIGPVLTALRSGQILLFDEIDASLHPRLSANIGSRYMPQRLDAARRAARLAVSHRENGATTPHDNPSSGMYRLIEATLPSGRQLF